MLLLLPYPEISGKENYHPEWAEMKVWVTLPEIRNQGSRILELILIINISYNHVT